MAVAMTPVKEYNNYLAYVNKNSSKENSFQILQNQSLRVDGNEFIVVDNMDMRARWSLALAVVGNMYHQYFQRRLDYLHDFEDLAKDRPVVLVGGTDCDLAYLLVGVNKDKLFINVYYDDTEVQDLATDILVFQFLKACLARSFSYIPGSLTLIIDCLVSTETPVPLGQYTGYFNFNLYVPSVWKEVQEWAASEYKSLTGDKKVPEGVIVYMSDCDGYPVGTGESSEQTDE